MFADSGEVLSTRVYRGAPTDMAADEHQQQQHQAFGSGAAAAAAAATTAASCGVEVVALDGAAVLVSLAAHCMDSIWRPAAAEAAAAAAAAGMAGAGEEEEGDETLGLLVALDALKVEPGPAEAAAAAGDSAAGGGAAVGPGDVTRPGSSSSSSSSTLTGQAVPNSPRVGLQPVQPQQMLAAALQRPDGQLGDDSDAAGRALLLDEEEMTGDIFNLI